MTHTSEDQLSDRSVTWSNGSQSKDQAVASVVPWLKEMNWGNQILFIGHLNQEIWRSDPAIYGTWSRGDTGHMQLVVMNKQKLEDTKELVGKRQNRVACPEAT